MREIKRVVVLGANGTMGSGSGALFAARGFQVTMLARTMDKARGGLESGKATVRSGVIERTVKCGDYERDLESSVAAADLVLEAVSEDIKVKKPLFDRIEAARRPGTVTATVSSGLSITEMAAGRSDDFRSNFLGMHLFNPPNVIVGTELIAGRDTDPEVHRRCSEMLRRRLGRVVVECRDLPAFAGNRIGFKVLNECAALAERHGVGFIDYLIGPYTGRAMPPLATIDLVGWDVHAAIVDNVYAKTSDEAHNAFALPQYMREMSAAGYLGNKTPKLGGFYRRSKDEEGGKVEQPLIPSERAHARSSTAVQKLGFVEEIKQLHAIGCYRDGMAKFLDAKGTEAELARRVVLGYVSYALSRVGPEEVVDQPRGVDDIMGYGFNWAPPSVLVALFGPQRTVGAMRDLGIPVPAVLASLGKDQSWLTRPLSNIGRYFVGK